MNFNSEFNKNKSFIADSSLKQDAKYLYTVYEMIFNSSLAEKI